MHKSEFRREELVILQKIRKLTLEIEHVASDGQFPESLLSQLNFLLLNLSHSQNENLQKISEIQDHLHPQMTLRHFLNFMVPVERLAGRNLDDRDFMITKLDRPTIQAQKFPLILVLENLRSAFNVGSIFRLADGLGASGIHLCGYTPLPDQKTSLGAETVVSTETFSRLEDSIAKLKQENFQCFGLETAENAKSLYEMKFEGPTALIAGNERFGLSPEVLKMLDGVIAIPMSGIKNSLNVSNALAIAGFEWKRQWIQSH